MKQEKPARIPLPHFLPAVVAAVFSGASWGAGFMLMEQNASSLGNAYAGTAAVADNASTIFFNPAGMTQLQAREFSVGLSAVRPSYKFSNNGSVVAPAATGGNGGDAGDWGYVPNGYLTLQLTKELYAGIGISAPFGLKTEYDSDWVGRFQSVKFDIKTINVNPAIAYRVNDMVSLGFGVSWQRFEAEYVRRAAVVADVPVNLNADDDSWGWNVGAFFRISPTTRIGASYRSAIKHTLEGDIATVVPGAAAPAKADLKLPDSFILSVAQQLDGRWEMLGDLAWTGWSSINQLNIIRTDTGATAQTIDAQFRDTWRVSLGANYKYSDAWKFKFGIAYDQTPVRDPEHRLTALPDENRWWFSVGAQWKPTKTAAVDFGAAYLYLKDPEINNNQLAAGRGLVKGSYNAKGLVFGVQYSQAF